MNDSLQQAINESGLTNEDDINAFTARATNAFNQAKNYMLTRNPSEDKFASGAVLDHPNDGEPGWFVILPPIARDTWIDGNKLPESAFSSVYFMRDTRVPHSGFTQVQFHGTPVIFGNHIDQIFDILKYDIKLVEMRLICQPDPFQPFRHDPCLKIALTIAAMSYGKSPNSTKSTYAYFDLPAAERIELLTAAGKEYLIAKAADKPVNPKSIAE